MLKIYWNITIIAGIKFFNKKCTILPQDVRSSVTKFLSFKQRKLWKGNVGFIVPGRALIAILIIELTLDTHSHWNKDSCSPGHKQILFDGDCMKWARLNWLSWNWISKRCITFLIRPSSSSTQTLGGAGPVLMTATSHNTQPSNPFLFLIYNDAPFLLGR